MLDILQITAMVLFMIFAVVVGLVGLRVIIWVLQDTFNDWFRA